MKLNHDLVDLLFRGLFCVIFLGLGAEHVFSDDLIRRLMPEWVPAPRAVSIVCGLWLLAGGGLILLGWRLRLAALGLGAFLILVTAAVHLPALFFYPASLPAESKWMWDILQRSNFVKNLCLLGVCFQLLHYQPGRYSVDGRGAAPDDGVV